MPGIIIAPHVEKAVIGFQGLFTVHREDADLECNCPRRRGGGCGGIEIAEIPLTFRSFELLANQNAKKWLKQMERRGREWAGTPILLHGPWPSRMVNLGHEDSPVWNEAMQRDKRDNLEHPERVLGFVHDLDAPYSHMDYMLVADFWIRDEYTDLEV